VFTYSTKEGFKCSYKNRHTGTDVSVRPHPLHL